MSCYQESIFRGAFRSFLKTIGAIIGLAVGFGIIVLVTAFFSGSQFLPPKMNPTLIADASGNRDLLPPSSPAILHINFQGVIGVGDLTTGKIHELLLQSRSGLLQRDRVKAVLLHINSPGGTVADSTGIYRELIQYKTKYHVPVYAYVDGLCASGGMYIASAADQIYASTNSLIGSVGVIYGPFFNFSEAMTKYGIGSSTLTAGKDKDMLNPFRPWKNDEGKFLQTAIEETYKIFVDVVCKARPKLSKENLVNTYGANVFIAQQAANLGYIDHTDANYEETLTDLTKVAQIEDKYQVIELSHQRPLLDKLSTQGLGQTLLNLIGLTPPLENELKGKLLYLYNP